MTDTIDWTRLRARISETPVAYKQKPVIRKAKTPEEKRADACKRSKKYYWSHRQERIDAFKAWERNNPEKVKAKKHKYYAAHKTDPEWMEHHRQKNRDFKKRKRFKNYVIGVSAIMILCGLEPQPMDIDVLLAA